MQELDVCCEETDRTSWCSCEPLPPGGTVPRPKNCPAFFITKKGASRLVNLKAARHGFKRSIKFSDRWSGGSLAYVDFRYAVRRTHEAHFVAGKSGLSGQQGAGFGEQASSGHSQEMGVPN